MTIFRNSIESCSLPATSVCLDASVIAHIAFLSQTEKKEARTAFQGPWVSDRIGHLSPEPCLLGPGTWLSLPIGPLPSMTLPMTCDEHCVRLRAGWGGSGPREESRPCAPTPSPLSNGVVNEKGQLRCPRLRPKSRRQRRAICPLTLESAGGPVPTHCPNN